MKVQFTKTIANTQINVTEEVKGHLEFFKTAAFFSSIPTKCGNCEKTDLAFVYRKTEENYEYCEVKCNDCEHTLKFGQHKEGKTLFAKGWEEPYNSDDDDEDEDEEAEEKPKNKLKKSAPEKTAKSSLSKLKSKTTTEEDEEETDEDTEEDSDEEEAEEPSAAVAGSAKNRIEELKARLANKL